MLVLRLNVLCMWRENHPQHKESFIVWESYFFLRHLHLKHPVRFFSQSIYILLISYFFQVIKWLDAHQKYFYPPSRIPKPAILDSHTSQQKQYEDAKNIDPKMTILTVPRNYLILKSMYNF